MKTLGVARKNERLDNIGNERRKQMSIVSSNDRVGSVECLRRLADETAEAELRDPWLWSFIVRDPAGKVFCRGHGFTRKACQRQALLHGSGHPEDLTIRAAIIRCTPHDDSWCFVAWPPSSKLQVEQHTRPHRPSRPQIEALMFGLANKLSRYSMGWCCDENIPDGAFVRMFHPSTIRALWKCGLLTANSPDPCRDYRELSRMEEPDGASRPQVSTSEVGIETLVHAGMLVLRDG
jgi:hypothetical protein